MKLSKTFLIPDREFEDICPVDGGYQSCPPNHVYGPSARTYTILHYVVSGNGVLKINDCIYSLKAGDCFIIKSSEIAYYCSDNENPWTYIWLGFKTKLPLPWEISNYSVIDGKPYEEVFTSLLQCKSTDNDISFLLCSKCWELFALMNKKKSVRQDALAQQTKRYIKNQYMNDISIIEFAKSMGVDRSTLSTKFKEAFGVSPQEYLCNHRLKIARELLESSDYSPSEIARMCGHKNYANFSKMFAKRYGISPREYRKDTRKEQGE